MPRLKPYSKKTLADFSMDAPSKILVAGHNGFLGRALCATLEERFPDARFFGMSRRLSHRPKWKTLDCDLANAGLLERLLERVRPDWIFHLAGVPVTPDVQAMLDGYLKPTATLLDVAEKLKHKPLIILPGSAGEYGVPNKLPVTEDAPANPVTHYGAAKAAQTALARVYVHRGLDVRIARIFNVLGPGLGTYMALSSFVRQVTEIERGDREPILETGDLSPKRDFVDVRDTAEALVAVAQHGKAGEAYNICSGRSTSIKTLTEALLKMANKRIRMRKDKSRMRPADIPNMRGSTKKSEQKLHWKAKIRSTDSLRAMLEHDRALGS
jgi:GDP-4-dehydro-6-deoxy-D-mannose reductase